MPSPFDYINDLTASKSAEWVESDEKDYTPFIINRGMSYFYDTVMIAAEMNLNHTIPKQWQYDFYKHAIQPKKKRFAKWAKPEEDALIDMISVAYQVNRRRAIEIRTLLSDSDVKFLKEKQETGGR